MQVYKTISDPADELKALQGAGVVALGPKTYDHGLATATMAAWPDHCHHAA